MADPKQRRRLHFNSLQESIAEAERLVEAEKAGRMSHCGNWSLGQTLGHLSTWAEFAFNGYPPEVHAPMPVRLILRLLRKRILTGGMMTGVKVGKVPGGTLGIEPMEFGLALDRFRSAFGKLEKTCPTMINPAFGKLTHEQWIQLNLRHAELHLGFQIPST